MKRVDVAYVLLLNEKDQVLMVKNKGRKESYFTLPGGAVEDGETLKQAAIREVIEETGLIVEVDQIFSLSEAFVEERGHHAVFFTFTGEIIGGKIRISFPEEIEDIRWIDQEVAEKHLHLPYKLKDMLKSNIPYHFRGTM
ncbi:NUDIX hydrolase [Halobacillus mangrovi]|uniref:NUDIX hydrolase n=1 Tax=Halobacillus mangrovi TaxID=402384 RepID=UPI003D974787